MTSTHGISIVIPTRNGGELFARCLRAIGAHDFDGPVELVVIDSA